AEISGIECVGVVSADPDRRFSPGQTVMALVGGMGRSIDGSYAELVQVPSSNVVAVNSDLAWEDLAAVPESYATAWTALNDNLALSGGQSIVIRGATSALGQAAVNIAANAGARVIAPTPSSERAAMLEPRGAQLVLTEQPELSKPILARCQRGIGAVLDLVSTTTAPDSIAMLPLVGR